MKATFAEIAKLLSDGLDLCVRARKLDAIERTNDVAPMTTDLPHTAARHNALWPDQPILTKSGTIPLWTIEQYETDLADWERKARVALQRLPSEPQP